MDENTTAPAKASAPAASPAPDAAAPAPAPAATPAAAPAAAPAAPIESFAEQFGVLVSRVANPVTVEYGDGHIRVSPRSTTLPLLRRLLPAQIPAGLTYVAR